MRAETTFNQQKVLNDFRARKIKAQDELNAMVIADSNQFCPMDTATLRNSAHVVNNKKSVEWNTPYATRVYYADGIEIKTQKNPKARPKWFEHAKAIQLKKWLARVEHTLKGGA